VIKRHVNSTALPITATFCCIDNLRQAAHSLSRAMLRDQHSRQLHQRTSRIADQRGADLAFIGLLCVSTHSWYDVLGPSSPIVYGKSCKQACGVRLESTIPAFERHKIRTLAIICCYDITTNPLTDIFDAANCKDVIVRVTENRWKLTL